MPHSKINFQTTLQNDMQKHTANKPGAFWVYTAIRKVMIVDKTTAERLDLQFDPNGIPADQFFESISWNNPERIKSFFDGNYHANFVIEDMHMLSGPFKGECLSILGGIVSRDEDGKMLLASGIISRNNQGNGRFFCHSLNSEGNWDWDLTTNEQTYSKSFLDLLGYDHTYPMPSNFDVWAQTIVHPDDLPELKSHLAIYLHSTSAGDSFECCIRLKKKDGSYLWTIAHGLVVERDDYGRALRVVGFNTDVNSLAKTLEQNTTEAYTDSLTGLANRNYLRKRHAFFDSQEAAPIGCIFIDITGLKAINDYLGHSAGDILIKRMALVLVKTLSHAGVILRLSGDEFILLISGCNLNRLEHLCITLRQFTDALLTNQRCKNGECTLFPYEEHLEEQSFTETYTMPPKLDLAFTEILQQDDQGNIQSQIAIDLIPPDKIDIGLNRPMNFGEQAPLLFGLGYAIVDHKRCHNLRDVMSLADERCQQNKKERKEQDRCCLAAFLRSCLGKEVDLSDSRLGH